MRVLVLWCGLVLFCVLCCSCGGVHGGGGGGVCVCVFACHFWPPNTM